MFLLVAFLIFSGSLFAAAYYSFVVPQRTENEALLVRLRDLRARSGQARVRGGGDLLQQVEGLNWFGKLFAWIGIQRRLQLKI